MYDKSKKRERGREGGHMVVFDLKHHNNIIIIVRITGESITGKRRALE